MTDTKSPAVTQHLRFMLQDLPKPVRANFILNVETDELFITAGLQDRVVQVSNIISATCCKYCSPCLHWTTISFYTFSNGN